MIYNISIHVRGRKSHSATRGLHAMAYGQSAITPRNLNQMLFQMNTQSTRSAGHTRQHNPLKITAKVDSASPQLFNPHWCQQVLESVILEIIATPHSGAAQVNVSRITLSNAVASNLKRYTLPQATLHEERNTGQLEEVQLTFQKIEFTLGASTSTSDNWSTA